MFFIFGLRSKDKFLGSTLRQCEICGATAAQTLVRRSTKFSLFFVPLFPVRPARHFVTCTHCGSTRSAARNEAALAS